jgi:hypothetical protein
MKANGGTRKPRRMNPGCTQAVKTGAAGSRHEGGNGVVARLL